MLGIKELFTKILEKLKVLDTVEHKDVTLTSPAPFNYNATDVYAVKCGHVVRLNFYINTNSSVSAGSYVDIGILPSDCAPPRTISCNLVNLTRGNLVVLFIGSNGVLRIYVSSNAPIGLIRASIPYLV